MDVTVLALYPDDETLGCGSTLLRRIAEGHRGHWIVITQMTERMGYAPAAIAARQERIAAVAERYGFASVTNLDFPAGAMETVPLGEVVSALKAVLDRQQPQELFLPFRSDAHSDHRACFDAATTCTKWFRAPWTKRVLCYETLSDTDSALGAEPFQPTTFVDISPYLEAKIAVMCELFSEEMGAFPFPRSAEAFRLLRERE